MIARRSKDIEHRLMTTSAIVTALVFILGGGFLLWWSGTATIKDNVPLAGFLGQLGGPLVATGLLAVGWDLFGRRTFAEAVLAKARLQTEVVRSGVTRITDQYLEDVEWEELFRDVTRLDIVVAYANTWRNHHLARLQRVASRPGTRIRVFLPDPDDQQTMSVLAERFATTWTDIASKVRQAVTEFKALAQPAGGSVEVRLRQGDLVFSCYRFDSRAVLTLYSHSRERRTQVPTFVVTEGDLFAFVYGEIEALERQSTLAP